MSLPLYSWFVSFVLLAASPAAFAFLPTSVPLLVSYRSIVATSDYSLQRQRFIALHQIISKEPTEPEDDDGNKYPSYSPLVLGKVVGYRALLGASALSISLFALGGADFFEGTGFDVKSLVESSETVLPWISGGALLACPVPQTERLVQGGAAALAIATMTSSSLEFLEGYSWSLSMLALMAISMRELWYFGGAYKQECGITLFMLPLMLDRSTSIPLTAPLCAVGLSILAGGKLLEPLEEDLVRSNSEFLAR